MRNDERRLKTMRTDENRRTFFIRLSSMLIILMSVLVGVSRPAFGRDVTQSTTRNMMVFMVDNSDHLSGKAGLTLTITMSKNGAAFATVTPTVTERGSGWYNLALTASHTDTLGDLTFHITAAGADSTDFVVGVLPSTVTVGTNNDKTGYQLTVTPPTAIQVRQEMDSNSTKLSNLDATVSSRLSTASYTAPPSVSAIRTEMDNNSTKLANLNASISSRMAATSYSAPDNAGIAAIKAATDKLDTTFESYNSVWRFTSDALSLGPTGTTGGGGLTAQQVWDYVLTGYSSEGLAGTMLKTAASFTVQIPDPWAVPIPAAYGAGTAGRILGGIPNGVPLMPSQISEIDAIKSVTDKLDTSLEIDNSIYRFTAAALALAPTDTAGGGTCDINAADIWNYDLSGYLSGNYAGAFLRAAGAAGDPWMISLPGAYSPGTAGAILGAVPNGVPVIPGVVSTGVLQLAITQTDNSPVTIVRGDAKTLVFDLGSGWPLSNKKVYFTAKKYREAQNSSAIINREATITDEVNGVARIDLLSSETATVGSYYAEVEVRNSDDTVPHTARQFILRIVQDVRQ